MQQLRAELVRTGVIKPFKDQKKAAYCSLLLAKFHKTGDRKSLVKYYRIKRSLPARVARGV